MRSAWEHGVSPIQGDGLRAEPTSGEALLQAVLGWQQEL